MRRGRRSPPWTTEVQAFDALPCAVLVTDMQGRVLAANAELGTLSGRDGQAAQALTLERMDDLLPPASRIFMQTHVWPSLLRNGSVSEVHLQVLGPQDQRVPVLANGKQTRFEGSEACCWTFFVVQERQRFETALLLARTRAEAAARAAADSERFTRSLADAVPVLIAHWDRELRCDFANKAYLAWWGRSSSELIGSHIRDVLGSERFAATESHVQAALRGQSSQFGYRLVLADGSTRHSMVHCVPDTVDGMVCGFVLVVSDLTQLKHSEDALRAEMAERERVHAQLRQNSAAMQQAQRLGRIGSWWWQVVDDAVDWSDELFRIFGRDPLLGAPPYAQHAALYELESFARLQAAVEQALHSGEPCVLELNFVRPDGVRGWVEVRGEAVRDAQGRIARLQGTVQDISERKQIERSLATERQRLANIIDSTQAGSWEWHLPSGTVQLNERSASMIGYPLDHPGLQTIDFRVQHTHPDDHCASRAAAKAHFEGLTQVYESEARMRHRDGHWVWVQERGRVVSRTADGRPEWMFGTHLDITPRKQQEQALRKSQDLLDRTGRLAGVGGWELDVASGELSWSDETRRLHGVAPDYQPRLESAIAFYAPEVQPLVRAAVERAMTDGEPWDLVMPLVRADGACIWVRAVGTAERENGLVTRLVGAFQDVTDRHALDERLAQKTADLRRSNEELERFAYVASHDLQEPLRMVCAYGQLLMRRHLADLKPEAQEFARYMVDGGQRAQALIRDLLSLARLDSQAMPWRPVALQATLDEVLTQLSLRVRESGATVTHDELPTVQGDARQMGQLLANLVGNALKFRGDRAPQLHVGAEREGSGWRISVRDNGIGIEPRYFERVFQMFQRLHLRSDYEGTGIGLAICKKVVERHGGRIGVESKPGEGTTFFFSLPANGRIRAPAPQALAERGA